MKALWLISNQIQGKMSILKLAEKLNKKAQDSNEEYPFAPLAIDPKVYLRTGVKPGEKLPSQSMGYPIMYITKNNDVVCAECANSYTNDTDPVSESDIYWEGPSLQCEECNKQIESAYGDPEDKS